MNKLKKKQHAQVISALVEGNSIRATARMTGVAGGACRDVDGGVGASRDLARGMGCQLSPGPSDPRTRPVYFAEGYGRGAKDFNGCRPDLRRSVPGRVVERLAVDHAHATVNFDGSVRFPVIS